VATDHDFKVEDDYSGMMTAQLVAAGTVDLTPA
jgi:hypothetical protein